MIDNHKLLDLLERWEELRERGIEPTLEELCAGCPELRGPLDEAIGKLQRVDAWVGQVAGEANTLPLAGTTDKRNGTSAHDGGRFQIMRPHRSGGLGEVLIVYDNKLEREVALKRMQTAQDVESRRRFLREAKITGHLEHPGIVPVHDLMDLADGSPSYVMRLIQGETLKEAIDRFHKESTKDALAFRQLLNRFLTVCQTIAYAHSRGIIHRDLKPANVILGKYGETMVVDWGLAKPVRGEGRELRDEESERAAEETPHLPELGKDSIATAQGQVVGTPQYMSPEQAAGRLDQVGPASDIYSLGVTLYCLLTGAAPFPDPRETSVQTVLDQVQRGQFRRPREMQRGIPRALEAICLKAMALRPEDRYASAEVLADDLEHWLADEPVTAYREPRRTRAARWLRRHKTLSTGLAALASTGLVALLIGTVLLARAKDKAQTAEAVASAINRFLTDDLLASVRPEVMGRDVTMRQALDVAAAELNGKFARQPEVEASIREAIGWTYYKLGLYPDAEPHLRTSVDLYRDSIGAGDPQTLEAVNKLGELLQAEGKIAEAGPLIHMNVETCRRVAGPEHRLTLKALNSLASLFWELGKRGDAESLLRENLEAYYRILGPDHTDTLIAGNNLAQVLQEQGKLTEAESLHRQNLEAHHRLLGPEHPGTLAATSNLAKVLQQQGKFAEAEPLHRQNLERRLRRLGPEHPMSLRAASNLALLLYKQGKFAEAEPLMRENVESQRRVLGPDHSDTLTAVNNLANLLNTQGKLAEAEPLSRRTLEARRRLLGPDHVDTLRAVHNLASLLQAQGKLTEAEPLFRESLESFRRVLGPDHPHSLTSQGNLALLLSQQGKLIEAEMLTRQNLESKTRILGAEHPDTLAAVNSLAGLLQSMGKLGEAESLCGQNLESFRRILGPDHPNTITTVGNLASVLRDRGKLAEAEMLYREVLSRRKALPSHHVTLGNSLAGLGAVLMESGKAEEAEPLLRESIEIRRGSLPKGHRLTAEVESALGGCLTALGHYADAEPFLLTSYETLRIAQGVGPATLPKAGERIIDLYEAWGKPEQAAEWRTKRDELMSRIEKPKDM